MRPPALRWGRAALGVAAFALVAAMVATVIRRDRAAATHARHNEGRGHSAAPSRILHDAPAGPYRVALWTTGEVGDATVHVVVDAAPGATFLPPARVRIGVAPASGRRPTAWFDATPAQPRRGARHWAAVQFDRAERWEVRAVISHAGVDDTVFAPVEVHPRMMHGPFGLILSVVPFVAVLAVWWRAAVVRRRRSPGNGVPREATISA